MALRSRGTQLVSNLLSRHAGWALCSSRGMAGHDLHAAFTPQQQQVRCYRLPLPPPPAAARGHPWGAALGGQAPKTGPAKQPVALPSMPRCLARYVHLTSRTAAPASIVPQ
jgi:hypothetical protein